MVDRGGPDRRITLDKFVKSMEEYHDLKYTTEGITIQEYAEAIGLCLESARLRFNRAIKEGKIKYVGERKIGNLGHSAKAYEWID
jgi:hypothetical protein